MTAANHIGYFAHLVDQGKMTEEEANKRLNEMFEADIRADEMDRKIIELMKTSVDKLASIEAIIEKYTDYQQFTGYPEYDEGFETGVSVVIEEIENIPQSKAMKPISIDGRMLCPNCMRNDRSLHHYCDCCGQPIDWSDE